MLTQSDRSLRRLGRSGLADTHLRTADSPMSHVGHCPRSAGGVKPGRRIGSEPLIRRWPPRLLSAPFLRRVTLS